MPQTVLAKEQNDPAFLVLVGSIYQTRHEWDRAQKYLDRRWPWRLRRKSGIELQLADIYAAQGNQQKAYAIYRKELDRNPQNSRCVAWHGECTAPGKP